MSNETIILAICGKSASGKDSLSCWLARSLKKYGKPVHAVISDTTRPRRKNETNNIDYNFLPKRDFLTKMKNQEYLEYTNFRGWYYGTDKTSIQDNAINIMVVNLDGLKNLSKWKNEYIIIPIYLSNHMFTRLCRSIKRENKIKLEYFRRIAADFIKFLNIEEKLYLFNYSIYLENINTKMRAEKVEQFLVKYKILPLGNSQ